MTTWQILNLERNASDGGVIKVYWLAKRHEQVGEAENESVYSAYYKGTTDLTPDASLDSFILFEDLTEDVVLGWVYNEINKTEIETQITNSIEEQKNPATFEGVPW